MTFDTYGDSAASSKIATYINGLPSNTVVMVAVVDTGAPYGNTVEMKSLGAVSPSMSYRESYAFIGYKGDHKPSWIREVKKGRNGAGPSIANTRIKLML